MKNELIESKSMFGLRFEGDSEIDATILSKTIADMAELIKIATKEENSEAYIKLNVTAFRNGSFQIDFSTVTQAVETLYNNITACSTLALTTVGIVKGIFEIKKFLKGRKAKSVDEVDMSTIRVEDNEGNTLVVPKSSGVVMQNVQVDQLTINISNYVQEHDPSAGFVFTTPESSLVCNNEDVRQISKSLPIEITTTCQRTQVRTFLVIKKADMLGKSTWDFYYKDKKISANINDDDWLERLHNREFLIGYQDMIEATLEVYVDLDLLGKPIDGSERYSVVKIHGGVSHSESEQTNLT